MSKVHKIDYDARDFLLGVAGLSAFDIGVYWVACSLIIEGGKPIYSDDERLYSIIKSRRTDIDAAIDRLCQAKPGREPKLERNGCELDNKRGRSEVERAAERIRKAAENGAKGGRPSNESKQEQGDGKPAGFSPEKLSPSPSPSLILSSQEEGEGVGTRKSSKNDYPPKFEELWAATPPRGGGGHDKVSAYKAWQKALAKGADPDQLIMLIPGCAAPEKYGTEFVPMLSTWLGKERWRNTPGPSGPMPAAPERGWKVKAQHYFARASLDGGGQITGWTVIPAPKRKWPHGGAAPDSPAFSGPRDIFDLVARELGVTDWEFIAKREAA